jgi:hypothetical protein
VTGGEARHAEPPLPNGKTRFVAIYRALAAAGFGPDQVDRWEPYQILAAFAGWRAANSQPTARAPSDAEFEEAVSRSIH